MLSDGYSELEFDADQFKLMPEKDMTNIDLLLVIRVLLLVVVANSAPVVAKKLFGNKLSCPVDGGLTLSDGREIFGKSKTTRGIVVSIVSTVLSSSLVGVTYYEGACVALAAMAGDLLSSFFKRRLGVPSSGMALGLDQLPEALLPALALRWFLGWPVTFAEAFVIGGVFFLGELVASRLFYALNLRDRPY
jgi:hypothetical protein